MIRGGEIKHSEHPDFPETVYGYVSFRKPDDDPRLGRHMYSTPFESDWHKLANRVAQASLRNDKTEPTFLVAKFQLVTVEAIDSRSRDQR